MLILRGKCLGVEHKSGEQRTDARTGEVRDAYSYYVAHVLDGWTARQCRIGDDYGPHPREGEAIEAKVGIRPYKRGAEAQVSITLEENLGKTAASGVRVAQ